VTIRYMRIACWLHNFTDKLSNLLNVLLSHCNNSCTGVPQRYVIRALSVLFDFMKHHPVLSNDVAEHSISRVFGLSVCVMNVFINSFFKFYFLI
jgi:hypothetical protein